MSDNEYVRAVRKRLGLNQADFGRLIGVSQWTIKRYEKEGGEVPQASMMAIQKLESDHEKE